MTKEIKKQISIRLTQQLTGVLENPEDIPVAITKLLAQIEKDESKFIDGTELRGGIAIDPKTGEIKILSADEIDEFMDGGRPGMSPEDMGLFLARASFFIGKIFTSPTEGNPEFVKAFLNLPIEARAELFLLLMKDLDVQSDDEKEVFVRHIGKRITQCLEEYNGSYEEEEA